MNKIIRLIEIISLLVFFCTGSGSVEIGVNPSEAYILDIVLYGTDRSVEREKNITVEEMQASLKVYGGGERYYVMQGPTFHDDDLWNPEESLNLRKVYQAVKGSSLRDLLNLVGPLPENGSIRLIAADEYMVELPIQTILAPAEEMGEPVLAWYTKDEGYIPEYSDGLQFFWLAPDGVFGNTNMKNTLPERCWRFFVNGDTKFPAAAGLSIKNVVKIDIFPYPD